ncbi:transcriptional regulator of TetR family [alpha proteobacterium U9-1i]|nr:transcriptional regulator of TetR family [alpha proteobacterium U9-1i]
MAMSVKVLSKGGQTRERIMDIAQDAVLHKGFAATSIDEIICEAGITKSGFFYHFKDKNDLAKALLQRYLDNEWSVFDALFKQADELSEDPLHSFLIFLKLFSDIMGDLPNGHPGCLVSSYIYQDHLFSRDVRDMTTEGHRIWRRRFRERLDKIAARYTPKIDINLDDLADMLSSVADGGIILSKSLHDPSVLPRQILQYRAYVRLVFQP